MKITPKDPREEAEIIKMLLILERHGGKMTIDSFIKEYDPDLTLKEVASIKRRISKWI